MSPAPHFNCSSSKRIHGSSGSVAVVVFKKGSGTLCWTTYFTNLHSHFIDKIWLKENKYLDHCLVGWFLYWLRFMRDELHDLVSFVQFKKRKISRTPLVTCSIIHKDVNVTAGNCIYIIFFQETFWEIVLYFNGLRIMRARILYIVVILTSILIVIGI